MSTPKAEAFKCANENCGTTSGLLKVVVVKAGEAQSLQGYIADGGVEQSI